MILRFDFDTWKKPCVERHFTEAGYTWTDEGELNPNQTTFMVEGAPSIRAGNDVFSAAMRECATGQP